jgi:pimeloyl-ACP methyl ester carboxylesterase
MPPYWPAIDPARYAAAMLARVRRGVAVLRQTAPGPPAVIAHSLGGRLALFLETVLDDVASVAVAGCAPRQLWADAGLDFAEFARLAGLPADLPEPALGAGGRLGLVLCGRDEADAAGTEAVWLARTPRGTAVRTGPWDHWGLAGEPDPIGWRHLSPRYIAEFRDWLDALDRPGAVQMGGE